jgi:hypothetical protein
MDGQMNELSTEIIDYISKDDDYVYVEIVDNNTIIDIRDMGVRIVQNEET